MRSTEISCPQSSNKAKEKYFTKPFNESIKVIQKTWIELKSLVSMK